MLSIHIIPQYKTGNVLFFYGSFPPHLRKKLKKNQAWAFYVQANPYATQLETFQGIKSRREKPFCFQQDTFMISSSQTLESKGPSLNV